MKCVFLVLALTLSFSGLIQAAHCTEITDISRCIEKLASEPLVQHFSSYKYDSIWDAILERSNKYLECKGLLDKLNSKTGIADIGQVDARAYLTPVGVFIHHYAEYDTEALVYSPPFALETQSQISLAYPDKYNRNWRKSFVVKTIDLDLSQFGNGKLGEAKAAVAAAFRHAGHHIRKDHFDQGKDKEGCSSFINMLINIEMCYLQTKEAPIFVYEIGTNAKAVVFSGWD